MRKFIASFKFAMDGIARASREQRNLRIHFVCAVLAGAAGFYFDITRGEWLSIVLAIALVVTAELANTAIEYLVDLISPERQAKAGQIKDIAAGAVLISAFAALIVGIIVFGPHLLHYFRTK